jgi:hypothetical protein
VLQSEHRAAPALPPVHLELVAADAETTHLEIVAKPPDGTRRGLEEQVLALLAGGEVLSRARLRESLAVKNERLGTVLESLEWAGRLCRTPTGWQRRDRAVDEGRSHSPQRERGNGTASASRRELLAE